MAQTNTTNTNSTLPGYITQPTTKALGDLQSWLGSKSNYVYGSKPGESLFTPLSTSQKQSIGNVNWLADQDLAAMLGTNKAGGLLDQFANFNPGRLVDEGGFLGKMSDYMNPYTQNVLDPQIRQIEENLQRGQRDLGANATMAGAFGDARHGIEGAQLRQDAGQAITDVTGKAYADAWNNAMGLRSSDRDAQVQQNANKATAAQGFSGLGQTYLKNFMDVNDALFNSGQVERDASEEQRVALQNFQTAIKDKKYNDALKLLGAVRGTPYQTNTTSTSTQKSDDGMWGLLGSVLGGVLG